MLTEQGFDVLAEAQVNPNELVVAVLPHPYHGRLVERVILYVRPNLTIKGEKYKLTWWGDGVAYYEPSPA